MNENFLNIDKWIYLVWGLYQMDNWITFLSLQVYCNFNVFREKPVNLFSLVLRLCFDIDSILLRRRLRCMWEPAFSLNVQKGALAAQKKIHVASSPNDHVFHSWLSFQHNPMMMVMEGSGMARVFEMGNGKPDASPVLFWKSFSAFSVDSRMS